MSYLQGVELRGHWRTFHWQQLGLKSQQGLKTCLHDQLQMPDEDRYADDLARNFAWHNQNRNAYQAIKLSSPSQKPELVIYQTKFIWSAGQISLNVALLSCLVLIKS